MAIIRRRMLSLSRAAVVSLFSLTAALAACSTTTPPSGSGGGGSGAGASAGNQGTAGATGTAGSNGRVPMKHRAAAVACSMDRPSSTCPAATTLDGGVIVACTRDTDCSAGTNGRCDPTPRINGCECSYDQCFADADCKTTGGPCECRPQVLTGAPGAGPAATPTNVCKPGNCRIDTDCGAGGYCSPSQGPCGSYGGVVGYFCHTPQDRCVDDADCTSQGGGDCRFDQIGATWVCQTSQCAG